MLVIIDVLIEHGADVNIRCIGEFTPLHQACNSGSIETVSRLIDSGGLVDLTDNNGEAPLHILVQGDARDRAAIATLLLEHGASIKAVNKRGQTALDLAKAAMRTEVLEAREQKRLIVLLERTPEMGLDK